MIIIQIFGWIFLVLFAIALITYLCLNWKGTLGGIRDFSMDCLLDRKRFLYTG